MNETRAGYAVHTRVRTRPTFISRNELARASTIGDDATRRDETRRDATRGVFALITPDTLIATAFSTPAGLVLQFSTSSPRVSPLFPFTNAKGRIAVYSPTQIRLLSRRATCASKQARREKPAVEI